MRVWIRGSRPSMLTSVNRTYESWPYYTEHIEASLKHILRLPSNTASLKYIITRNILRLPWHTPIASARVVEAVRAIQRVDKRAIGRRVGSSETLCHLHASGARETRKQSVARHIMSWNGACRAEDTQQHNNDHELPWGYATTQQRYAQSPY